MEENYKGHFISSGTWRVAGSRSEWKPSVTVHWHDGDGRTSVKTFTGSHFNCIFSTEKEAESYAHQFARNWIDDGKSIFPDLQQE